MTLLVLDREWDTPIPSMYDWAGGIEEFERLTSVFYAKVAGDELVGPLFADMDADHPRYVAMWLAEVFGGPARYSDERGGYHHMITRHLGKAITKAQRRRWMNLLIDAADEVGLPADPEFRAAFVSYIEWRTRLRRGQLSTRRHPADGGPRAPMGVGVAPPIHGGKRLMSTLDELSELVRTTAAAAGPSVVWIRSRRSADGLAVIASGRVLTNAHNLRDRTTSVRFADGRTEQAEIVGSDVDGDLVVLDVDTGDALRCPGPARQPSRAISSSPSPLVANSSARPGARSRRRTEGSTDHAGDRSPGPSSTPPIGGRIVWCPRLLDRAGHVVGVNTHRIDHGFYLARVADEALRARVAAMSEGRSFERLQLGVALAPPHQAARLRSAVGLPERDGLLVRAVVDGSPAAAAGIQKGDLLVRAGDRDLVRTDDLFEVLATTSPGAELTVDVVRGSDETLTVSFSTTDDS